MSELSSDMLKHSSLRSTHDVHKSRSDKLPESYMTQGYRFSLISLTNIAASRTTLMLTVAEHAGCMTLSK